MTKRFFRDGFIQLPFQFLIAATRTQQYLQVGLFLCEEAGFQFSISREPQTITGSTEMIADGADKPDLPNRPGKFKKSCRPIMAIDSVVQ